MKRQSAVLINSAAADERVMHAMIEIENLTKQMEMEKKKHEDEVGRNSFNFPRKWIHRPVKGGARI